MKPIFRLRLATETDIPALHELIEASIRGLQAGDYTAAQIEGALGTVLGLDTQLIRDKTYFVAETLDQNAKARSVGCGGWSKRKTLFGADRGPGRVTELLDPETDAAAGFQRFEMGSTLTGVPLYKLKGYVEVEQIEVPLANGEALPVVRMEKPPAERPTFVA